MSAYVKVGTFVGRNTSGTVAVTTGFQPKVVMVLAPVVGAYNVFNTSFYVDVGFASGTGANQWTLDTSGAWDAAITFNHVAGRGKRGSEVISEITSVFGLTNMLVSVTSFDVTGFTLTFVATGGSTNTYMYLAIGGDEVDISLGTATWPTSIGTQTVSGLGFTPDLLLLLAGPVVQAGQGGTTPGAFYSMGWVDGGGRQGCSGFYDQSNVATTNCTRYQRTDQCLALHNTSTGALVGQAEFGGFGSGTFALDWTAAHPTAGEFTYLAIRGLHAYAGAFDSSVAAGVQTISTPGTAPSVVLFQSVGAAASASVQNDLRYTLGLADVAASLSVWAGDITGTTYSGRRSLGRFSDALALQHTLPTSTSSGTVEASAALSALRSGSFDLTWSAADGSAREVLFLALGTEAEVITGSMVAGVNTTVTAARAIAFGLDGNTNTHSDAGMFKVFGDVEVTGETTVEDLVVNGTATIPGLPAAPVGASYVTLGTDATLTNERVLTAGTGISLTDAGAGSTLTVAATGSGGAYKPLTTGAEPLEFVSDGAGDVVMVAFTP